MAGDLIPPPSPAGTPPPDAVAPPLLAPRAAPGQDGGDPGEPAAPAPTPFRSRFGFAWGVLAGIAVCALGAFVLLLTGGRDTGPRLAANWSSWQPETPKMLEGAEAIADHVSHLYKLDSGDQMVQITPTALDDQVGVAIQPRGEAQVFLEGEGLVYRLAGTGPSGRLPNTPSKKRGRLLLREALELALYSFRYLDDVTMVGVLLPQTAEQFAEAQAAQGTSPPRTNAVFYRPGDLLSELQVPLSATLSPRTPKPSTMTDAEAARVDSLTLRNVFLASVQALEADKSYLVLTEPETVE